MIHYIIQVIAFQLFFLLIYDVFLKKETFFNWNRAYLLLTAVLSILLPFVKVVGFKEAVPNDFVVSLPYILSQTTNTIFLEEVVISGSNTSHSFLWYFSLVLVIGSALAVSFFSMRLFKIVKLIYQNPKQREGAICFVRMLKSTLAFSFFNYVFLGENIKDTDRQQIVKHELVHVKQKHTWDLLFFEMLRIVFWFNPFVYMYQNRMADLHEFIADSQAVKHNKKQYYENLLAQIFDTNQVSFINPFFKQSLIKKRIIMLQKTKSKQVQLIKYALLIPMVLGMLVYSSCSDETSNATEQNTDVSKYGYTLELGKNGLVDVPADKHEAYETFLKNNPAYVSWAQINKQNTEITYSVHSKDEQVPLGLTKVGVESPDGKSYVMYISLPSSKATVSLLKEKLNVIIEQIVLQDGLNAEGKEGIELLLQMNGLSSKSVNQDLISDVQDYINASDKNVMHQHISDLFQIIQEKGNLSEEEEIAMKDFFVFLSQEDLDVSSANNMDVPFASVDQVPVFPGCENGTSNEENKLCMSKKLNTFVAKNFNTELAKSLNLTGVVQIRAFFKINELGEIVNIKARAPHPELEVEVKRVLNMLPDLIPGEHQGEKVTVPYYLPIKFKIND
ncbi:M56 family metallopeptidase [Bizionia sp.]|uniref:M56 family metallopeptidase n=1 Tax=Bizionia sp. TaxID=1954480 RepID=UPI003A91D45C